MKPLYFAPLNHFSNAIYREFMLLHGADFVFSELIMMDRVDTELVKNKLEVYGDYLDKTIFQIGAKSDEEIIAGVNLIAKTHPNVQEINLNAGCPQSTMQKIGVCGGLLYNKESFFSLAKTLYVECQKVACIPSVKIRLGTSPDAVEMIDYLQGLRRVGIKKVYIHARTLRYNYTHPALYQYFKGVKEEFSDLELIFNGDVDSYKRYQELVDLGADGVMVGRAALSNQEIFSQIKNKQPVKSPWFDPFLNDPEIIVKNGSSHPTKRKLSILQEFISLAESHNLALSLTKKHLLHCIKGVSNRQDLAFRIRDASSYKELFEIFVFS